MFRMLVGYVVIILLSLPALSFAQTYDENNLGSILDLYDSEEMISIATGQTQPIYSAPAVANVITARQIKEMGAHTLDEVLERVPGLHVGISDHGRVESVYSIRGIHTTFNSQVLILMNGVPFPYYGTGRPLQFQLPVTAIERIEILRGPASAVYGADAYAGVIDIITKKASNMDTLSVGFGRGSFNKQNFWLQSGVSKGGWDIAFTFESIKSDGDNDRRIGADFQSTLDSTFGTSASYAPGSLDTNYNVIDTHLELSKGNWTIRNWFWDQHDAGVGAGVALALSPESKEDYTVDVFEIEYAKDNILPNTDVSVGLNHYYFQGKTHFVLLPPGSTVPIGSDGNIDNVAPNGLVTFTDGMIGDVGGWSSTTGLDVVANYNGLDQHRIRAAVGGDYFSGHTNEKKNYGPGVIDGTSPIVDGSLTSVTNTPNVYLSDPNSYQAYISLQDIWEFKNDWELTSGLRYDYFSKYGSVLVPRIGITWHTNYNLTSKLLYGRAFRIPSLIEAYTKNNPVALGNPDIDPETIDTAELVFNYNPTVKVATKINFFAYKAHGIIDFVPSLQGTQVAQNALDQTGYGAEFEVDWELNSTITVGANYAYQMSKNDDTGSQIPYAPVHQASAFGTLKFLSQWSLYSEINWIGKRRRDALDNRPDVSDYALVNANIRRSNVMDMFDFSVTVRNIFDKKAYEPGPIELSDDYVLEGRSIWAEISMHF